MQRLHHPEKYQLGYKRQSGLGQMFGQLKMVGYSFILVDYCRQVKMLVNVVKVWKFF